MVAGWIKEVEADSLAAEGEWLPRPFPRHAVRHYPRGTFRSWIFSTRALSVATRRPSGAPRSQISGCAECRRDVTFAGWSLPNRQIALTG